MEILHADDQLVDGPVFLAGNEVFLMLATASRAACDPQVSDDEETDDEFADAPKDMQEVQL